MRAIASTDLIAELDYVLRASLPDRREQMLRQVAELFIEYAHRLSERHIDMFDDILIRLTEDVALRSLTMLSRSLADLRPVPRELARRLANHDDADVAAPILRQCDCIPDADLVDIAWMRAEGHLCAIASRKTVNRELVDILLMRGDSNVARALARNPGAVIDGAGFAMLVDAAERDEDIACSLISRGDLPPSFLSGLISRVPPRLLARLVKCAPASAQSAIRIAIDAGAPRKAPIINYVDAQATVSALNKAGQLNDSSVNRFAMRGERSNVVAALAQLATVPIEAIEPLMEAADITGLIVACRASRLNWDTTAAIVKNREDKRAVAIKELDGARHMFDALSLSIAQRTIRFGSITELTATFSATAGER
ncbi:DUF2336 domain-containing protein [Bradyrhizobium sp. ORS 86]|uniref:DUF2336 domain-containing protein n=1 Tax=Bradyrhizobium sp. ORS 86 TaxID=1685970 RepID=UPI00388DF4CC